jgi:hypothetical protein
VLPAAPVVAPKVREVAALVAERTGSTSSSPFTGA